jgi:hypothetical protein
MSDIIVDGPNGSVKLPLLMIAGANLTVTTDDNGMPIIVVGPVMLALPLSDHEWLISALREKTSKIIVPPPGSAPPDLKAVS